MNCSVVIEQFYPPYDNVALVVFKEDGAEIDFSSATRFIATFGDLTLDTDVTADSIETTLNQGELKFDLSSLVLVAGQFGVTLVVEDPLHLNGQLITCDNNKNLIFDIKSC